jgi:hypothetical protein
MDANVRINNQVAANQNGNENNGIRQVDEALPVADGQHMPIDVSLNKRENPIVSQSMTDDELKSVFENLWKNFYEDNDAKKVIKELRKYPVDIQLKLCTMTKEDNEEEDNEEEFPGETLLMRMDCDEVTPEIWLQVLDIIEKFEPKDLQRVLLTQIDNRDENLLMHMVQHNIGTKVSNKLLDMVKTFPPLIRLKMLKMKDLEQKTFLSFMKEHKEVEFLQKLSIGFLQDFSKTPELFSFAPEAFGLASQCGKTAEFAGRVLDVLENFTPCIRRVIASCNGFPGYIESIGDNGVKNRFNSIKTRSAPLFAVLENLSQEEKTEKLLSEIRSFTKESSSLCVTLIRKCYYFEARKFDVSALNRGIKALCELEELVNKQSLPSPEFLNKVTLTIETARGHTNTCIDAARSGMEEFELRNKLLQMESSDASLSDKITALKDIWSAEIRKMPIGKLSQIVSSRNLYNDEVVSIALLFDNLHRRSLGKLSNGMDYAFCAKNQLTSFNTVLEDDEVIRDITDKKYQSLKELQTHYELQYADALENLKKLFPLKFPAPTETDPNKEISIEWNEVKSIVMLMLHAKDNNSFIKEVMKEGSLKFLAGDVKQISLANLPETMDVDGKEYNVRQNLTDLAKYMKERLAMEHVVLADKIVNPGSSDEASRKEIAAKKSDLLAKVQSKLQELESLSAPAKFGMLSELYGMVDISEILEKNPDLYQKFSTFMSTKFEVNLQHAVVLQEVNKCVEKAII